MRLRAGRSLRPRRLPSQAVWAFLAFLCLLVLLPAGARIAGQTKPAAAPAADPLLPILTDELRRNVEGLKREATPPYFASYTVYDVQRPTCGRRSGRCVGSPSSGTAAPSSTSASATTRSTTPARSAAT